MPVSIQHLKRLTLGSALGAAIVLPAALALAAASSVPVLVPTVAAAGPAPVMTEPTPQPYPWPGHRCGRACPPVATDQ